MPSERNEKKMWVHKDTQYKNEINTLDPFHSQFKEIKNKKKRPHHPSARITTRKLCERKRELEPTKKNVYETIVECLEITSPNKRVYVCERASCYVMMMMMMMANSAVYFILFKYIYIY